MTPTHSPSMKTFLGRTGLQVGRLGVAASYGVPARAVEHAFDCGVNYLYWGSRRTAQFGEALRNLRAQRDRVVLVLQSYSYRLSDEPQRRECAKKAVLRICGHPSARILESSSPGPYPRSRTTPAGARA